MKQRTDEYIQNLVNQYHSCMYVYANLPVFPVKFSLAPSTSNIWPKDDKYSVPDRPSLW